MNIGHYNKLTVERILPQGAYLGSEEDEVLLPQKYLNDDIEIGDEVEVFVYCDSKDRPVATTEKPIAQVDEFAALKVTDQNEYGYFLYWGLEKDLFVPHSQTFRPLAVNRTYVFRILYDDVSHRLLASAKIRPFIDKDTSTLKKNMKISAMIYEIRENYCMALINKEFHGMIPSHEFKEYIEMGSEHKMYIKDINKEGKVTLSFAPAGFDAREKTKNEILDYLNTHNGFIPLNDKSSPEEIKDALNMSKKTFKKLTGNLLRAGKIQIKDNGIIKL